MQYVSKFKLKFVSIAFNYCYFPKIFLDDIWGFIRLKEIFRDTLYRRSGGLQTFKSKSLLVFSILILDFRPKAYLITPEVSITVVYVFAGLVNLMTRTLLVLGQMKGCW